MENTHFFWYLFTKHIIHTHTVCIQQLESPPMALFKADWPSPKVLHAGCQEQANWLVLWGSDSVFSDPSSFQTSRLGGSVDTLPFWTARSWTAAARWCLCASGQVFCARIAPPSAARPQVSFHSVGCGRKMNSVFLLLPLPSPPSRGGNPLRASLRQRHNLARMCWPFFRGRHRLTCYRKTLLCRGRCAAGSWLSADPLR